MSDSTNAELAAAQQRLAALFVGNIMTQLVYVAAKLGIPDLLASQALTSAEIASAVGANARELDAMLRALAAMDAFAIDGGGRYSLRPLGALLKSHPGWRSQAILVGEEYYRATGDLLHTALTGEPAFDHALGVSFYDYFRSHPDAAERFNEAMIMSAPLRYSDVPDAFDFSRARTIVDVGGGHGALLSIILNATPGARAVLLDSAEVIEGSRRYLASQGLTARCDCVGGDFFEAVPHGGDVYLLSSVIVNWPDDRALKILRNCRAAMRPTADLLLVEYATLAGRNPSLGALMMAVGARAIQGSIPRTEDDYRALLTRAGFRIERLTPLQYEPYVLIHARPD
ncbi:MAG TPA: methyltransferase [Candidatus Acidoferrales bacterium]|nr:methyltransferase [Candidatus Acidoferrales bacterium]